MGNLLLVEDYVILHLNQPKTQPVNLKSDVVDTTATAVTCTDTQRKQINRFGFILSL